MARSKREELRIWAKPTSAAAVRQRRALNKTTS
jgi:hypothetical protein